MIVRSSWLASMLLVCGACPAAPSATEAEKKAQAEAEQKAKEDEEAEKRRAEIRQKREQAEAAQKEQEEARERMLDEIAIVPANVKPPKKLAAACQAVVDAHDAFMNRHYAGDAETLEKWNTAKGTQVPFTLTTCNKTGSVETAMCQKHALDHAPAELKADAPEILRRCIDKFAGGQAARGPALPTKRPG